MRYLIPILSVVLLISCSDDTTQQSVDSSVSKDRSSPPGPDKGTPRDKKAAPDKVSLDSAPPDSAPLDSAPPDKKVADQGMAKLDVSSSFPYSLDGIWLVGWIGGLNRFSWVKFQATSAMGGNAWILDGKGLSGGTVPYWKCSGKSSYNITAKPNTIQLQFHSPLCNGYKSTSYTFGGITKFSGSYPKGATHKATVTAYGGSTPAQISGYKFPASQCDAKMTKCTDPL